MWREAAEAAETGFSFQNILKLFLEATMNKGWSLVSTFF